MTTYAVIRKSDGQEVYRYSADAPIEWNGMEFATHDHIQVVEPVDPGTVVIPGPRRLSKLGFVGRLGADFATILTVAKSNVEVELFVRMLDWATPDPDGTSVDLDDARVIYALNNLEAAGVIGTGRAAEILV
jgi:hypothetical protein